jgi:hypothetical protein
MAVAYTEILVRHPQIYNSVMSLALKVKSRDVLANAE